MLERRRYERVAFFCPVHLTVEPDGPTIASQSFDISLGGVGLMTPISLERGQAVNVCFHLRNGSKETIDSTIAGHVAYTKADEDGVRLGIEFLSPIQSRPSQHWPENSTNCRPRREQLTGGLRNMAFEDWFIAHARVSSKPHKAISLDDKMTFFQQLGTLVASGTPLLQAMELCADQSQSLKLQAVLLQIASRVASGSSVHAAAANFPNVFLHHWIEVIRTGEITGQMTLVLGELNNQIRESRETRRKVMGSLMYPIILICVAVLAVTAMLWLVVPVFAKMFHDMGAELPATTQFVVNASNWLVKYGLYAVAVIIVGGIGIRQYSKTENGRRQFIGVGIGLPMIGELIVNAAMYQFASTSPCC